MHLKNNMHIPDFLQAVTTCHQDVLFETPEGDILNLKSTISQFIFTAVIIGELSKPDGIINLCGPEDAAILAPFLTE